jgi:hypothetical protein
MNELELNKLKTLINLLKQIVAQNVLFLMVSNFKYE